MPIPPDRAAGGPSSALKGTAKLLTGTLNALVMFGVREGFVVLSFHRCLMCIKDMG